MQWIDLHRDFEQDAVALAADHDRRRVQRLLRTVEIADECFQPTLEMQGNGLRLDAAQEPAVSSFEFDPRNRYESPRSATFNESYKLNIVRTYQIQLDIRLYR
jgi:hypothetical protein